MKESRPDDENHAARDWQSPRSAEEYSASREPSHDRRYYHEEAIVNHWLDELPEGALILDVPCGSGRFVKTTINRHFRYVGGDISVAMIDQARRQTASPLVQGFLHVDLGYLPLRDNCVDCIIIWRLFHHLRDAEIRQALLREACRVTRRTVLVSFHHPISFTFVRKLIQRSFLGKGHGSEITQWRLKREAAQCGLQLMETLGFRKYVSINWFALLRKL